MTDIRLLVLDDDDVIRENLLAYLEDEGFDVTGSSSAENAVELLKDHVFDAGIIDMRLPGMDGAEFILKAYKLNPDMRFVIHTGSTNYVLSDELRKIGIMPEQVLLKPVKDMAEIIDTLKACMGE
jgi:DNA-binding NtrC family response regulator